LNSAIKETLPNPYQLPTSFGPSSGQVHQSVDLTPIKYEPGGWLVAVNPLSGLSFTKTGRKCIRI